MTLPGQDHEMEIKAIPIRHRIVIGLSLIYLTTSVPMSVPSMHVGSSLLICCCRPFTVLSFQNYICDCSEILAYECLIENVKNSVIDEACLEQKSYYCCWDMLNCIIALLLFGRLLWMYRVTYNAL